MPQHSLVSSHRLNEIDFSSPSTTLGIGVKNDYTFAETLGRGDENCENVFSRCTYSLMNIVSEIY